MKKIAMMLGFLLVPGALLAQDVPKGEVGISYELYRPANLLSPPGPIHFDNSSGISVRATVNLNEWAAVETVFSFHTNSGVENVAAVPVPNGSLDIFYNTYRFKGTSRQGDQKQVGVFAFAGPGWWRADPNAAMEPFIGTLTKFAFEFGGGIEYYPQRNVGFRFELSDLVVKIGTEDGVRQPTTNNFVLRIGASFRF
ncbi:porin family protein [Acidobacteriia bacterium AH_259_A11_L15]|nr:porin family protein [Acidobacteriia bacterium AH_259_A11_L15]